MSKIYFACSITGGRDHAHVYEGMVEHIKSAGHEVLCELFASKDVDPGIGLMRDLTARGVWEADLAWVKESAAVIAETTQPSLGVGYEIAKAHQWDKPVLALYFPREGRKLSPMISGSPNVQVAEYTAPEEAHAAISAFLDSLKS
jgi:hypothetical protein